ncbi:MAG TPA: exodeoxyribonuclease VII small subunit [Candidatus Binataceae bacterium]|nr:exodeoxyribonuclease VII small subunit [Candidatus Binataceae bacterium]
MAAKEKKFEDELKDLEEVVARIDSGELTLEDSIAAFEQGVALIRALNKRLDEAERRIEMLTRNARDELKSVALAGFEQPASEQESENDDDGEEPPA